MTNLQSVIFPPSVESLGALLPHFTSLAAPALPELIIDPIERQNKIGLSNDRTYASILYSRAWNNLCGDRDGIIEAFQGHVVVDLAAGSNPYGYLLACEAKARGYIGIEPYYATYLKHELSNQGLSGWFRGMAEREGPGWNPPERLIPYYVVESDMRSFLRSAASESLSMFAIGLHHILPDDYANECDKEAARVLSKDGCLLTYPSGGINANQTHGSNLGCSYVYTKYPRQSTGIRIR